MTFRCTGCERSLVEKSTDLEANLDGGPPAWRTKLACEGCGKTFTRWVQQAPPVDGRMQPRVERWVPEKPPKREA